MTWEPRSGIFLGTWYVCGHSFFNTPHLFCVSLGVDFYLPTKIVKVIFVKNRVLGLILVG